MVANGDKIKQIEEGIVPFDVPAVAAHIAVFKNMPNVLLAAGPLVKTGCYIVLDTPQAKIIDKKTGKVILTSDFEAHSATWDVYPSQTKPKQQKGPIKHIANNAYRIETKKELIEFYHKAAGHPVKKTWIAAIERGAYASWPGLTAKLVQRFLEKQRSNHNGLYACKKVRCPKYQTKNPKINNTCQPNQKRG